MSIFTRSTRTLNPGSYNECNFSVEIGSMLPVKNNITSNRLNESAMFGRKAKLKCEEEIKSSRGRNRKWTDKWRIFEKEQIKKHLPRSFVRTNKLLLMKSDNLAVES